MQEISHCPFCRGELTLKEVQCQCCTTQIRGNFKTNRFHIFDQEDLFFIEVFLKNEGNIKAIEKDLGISYPTVKSRLKSIIKMLGYQADEPKTPRTKILSDLSEGKINVQSALKSLREIKS